MRHVGVNVLLWGGVFASGFEKLTSAERNMDRYQNKNILEQNLIASADKLSLGRR